MGKMTLTKGMLDAAVKGLSMVVPRKPAKAVFGCVRIVAKDGGVKLLATDLEQWAEFRHTGVETVGESNFLFGLAELKLLLRLPSDGKLRFESEPGTVTVKIGELSKEYADPGVKEFPEMPEVTTSPLAIGAEFFHKLRLAQLMLLKDKTSPALGCFNLAGGRIVATNRRELVVFNYELGLDEPILLSPPKLLGLFDADGTLARQENLVELKSGPWRTSLRIPPGTYPNYEQVIPKPSTLASEFLLSDDDRGKLLNMLSKLKIAETHEPVILYGSTDGVTALTGILRPSAIALPGSSFQPTQPNDTLSYVIAKSYLIDALRCGFNRFRSADGSLLVAQSDATDGFLILMSLSGRISSDQLAAAVAKVPVSQSTQKETPTMSNQTQNPASAVTKPAVASSISESSDFKVVTAPPVDPFAAFNATLDKLHNQLYALNGTVSEISKLSREAQRAVKQRERGFRELQSTIDKFKKVANF